MNYVDAAILDVTEWCCRRFQLLTGRTNVWLAVQLTNLTIVVYFVWAAVSFWSTELWLRISVGLFCGAVLYALTRTIFKVPIEESENNAYRRVVKGFRNPRRLRDAPLRLSFLTLCVVLPVLYYPINLVDPNLAARTAFLTYSLIVFTTVLLYVLACDPLPPCAGRVKEWLRRVARSGETVSDSLGDVAHTTERTDILGHENTKAPRTHEDDIVIFFVSSSWFRGFVPRDLAESHHRFELSFVSLGRSRVSTRQSNASSVKFGVASAPVRRSTNPEPGLSAAGVSP